jgi:hypothetical protein
MEESNSKDFVVDCYNKNVSIFEGKYFYENENNKQKNVDQIQMKMLTYLGP